MSAVVATTTMMRASRMGRLVAVEGVRRYPSIARHRRRLMFVVVPSCASSSPPPPPPPSPLRMFPLPDPPLPPRIQHIVLGPSDGGPAAAVLARHVDGDDVDEVYARQLVMMGAVYYAPELPPRGEEGGSGGGGGGVPRELRPQRVRCPDALLADGGYCRVHVHPKRFPAAHAVDWAARIVAKGTGWVVVDKPMGINVGPTVDNAVECVAQCVASALLATTPSLVTEASSSAAAAAGAGAGSGSFTSWAESTPLLVTHRLDAATSGVMMLARDSSFARTFNNALRDRRHVKKLYRTLTLAPPPLGTMEHWVVSSTSGPRRHLMHPLRDDDVAWEEVAAEAAEAAAALAEEEEEEEEEEGDAEARFRGDASYATCTSTSSSVEARWERRMAEKTAKSRKILRRRKKKKASDPFTHPDGRQRCVLRVLRCESIQLDLEAAAAAAVSFHASSTAAENDDGERENCDETTTTTTTTAYESTVELITGRTHQIRAQFAAQGVPLVGDVLYGGMSLKREESSSPDSLIPPLDSDGADVEKPPPPPPPPSSPPPPRVLGDGDPLGLQAAELTVDTTSGPITLGTSTKSGCGDDTSTVTVFKAGVPWWRSARTVRRVL